MTFSYFFGINRAQKKMQSEGWGDERTTVVSSRDQWSNYVVIRLWHLRVSESICIMEGGWFLTKIVQLVLCPRFIGNSKYKSAILFLSQVSRNCP